MDEPLKKPNEPHLCVDSYLASAAPQSVPPPGSSILAEINTLRNQVSALQQQVADLDKSGGRGFELLKWGMGMFAAFALSFSGFNWWAGKTNYDRDKDSLKQQTVLLEESLTLAQKEMELANDRQLTTIRSQAESNLVNLERLNDRQLAQIRSDAESNIVQVIAARKTEIVIALSNVTAVASVLSNSVQVQLDDNTKQTHRLLDTIARTNHTTISGLLLELNRAMVKTEAMSLTVQANLCLLKNDGKTMDEVSQFAVGIASLAQASQDWLKAEDDEHLRQCLGMLDKYFPSLIVRRHPVSFLSTIESLNNIGDKMDSFIQALQGYQNNRYNSDTQLLRLRNELFKKLVQEDREARLTPAAH